MDESPKQNFDPENQGKKNTSPPYHHHHHHQSLLKHTFLINIGLYLYLPHQTHHCKHAGFHKVYYSNVKELLLSNHTDKGKSNKIRSSEKKITSSDDFMLSVLKENDLMSED